VDIASESPYFLGIILILSGFLCGIVFAALFNSQRRKKRKDSTAQDSSTYLKGINYILSNESDRAIEEFSKVARINSDTVETYIALGNLFRSKGEVGRALRIHQSIIVRPNIDTKIKIQAYYDLSLDFKQAGFIERAVQSFEEVIKMDNRHLDAYLQLLGLYEDMKEWEKAYQIQLKISKLRGSSDSHILAYHQTELAKSLVEQGLTSQAYKVFKKAISLNRRCTEAYLHLGDLYFSEKKYKKAVQSWKNVMEITPQYAYLAYPRLEEAYFNLNQFGKIEEVLRENADKNRDDIQTHIAMAEHLYRKSMPDEAIGELRSLLESQPLHMRVRRQLAKYLKEQGRQSDAIKVYESILDDLPFPEKNFQCGNCGYESKDLQWRCPQCRSWDTIAEKSFKRKAESAAHQ